MFRLPKIYPITDMRISGLTHAEQCRRLIEGGAEFIQIREKYLSSNEFFQAAGESMKIAGNSKVKIIINDRLDIALAVNADGVHLGQNDIPPARAREILGENKIIGFSTHNQEQILQALNYPVDYLAIGPVFSTQTKENADKTVGLEGVLQASKLTSDLPLVAIGGINLANYREVLAAGADSAAIISGILKNKNISESFREFSKI